MEACESAVNILAQGKRNMVCGEIPTAVNQFQEACRILSKAYGETAKECADAYFCYGQALLDLARMENGVLGNALQGEEDEGSVEEGEEEEGEGTEEEGEGTEEEGEEAEGETAAEEGEETASQDGSQDGENPDDVSNLQLAWEMLELAKLIYLKDESKEAKLRAAESHLKLGEVSLETEQYEEAVKDLNKCLELQTQLLDPDNRLLAETHYQLGLAYCFNKQFKESTDSYQAAIKVIEDRIANLDKILEKATEEEKDTKDFDSPIYKAKKEVGELKELVPDIKAKIEDVEDEKKNMDDLKNLAKEALGGLSSSSAGPAESAPAAPKEDVQASDISHLIKRKRKSEEPGKENAKKPKQEEGDGDAKVSGDDKVNGDAKVNGTAEKESQPEAMETKS